MTPVPPAVPRVDTRHPQYQELKSRVHQGLLSRLNLERLTRVSRNEAEPEIRGVIMGMLDAEESGPLSLFERQSLIGDVLDGFRLNTLEGCSRTRRCRHPREPVRPVRRAPRRAEPVDVRSRTTST